jgi:hypothetical protein
MEKIESELKNKVYSNADDEYRKYLIQVETTEMVVQDLKSYYDALDK